MFGIGQYLTTFTGQLVEFLGWVFQSLGPCHIVFFINLGLNNYLTVTNVDRNEPKVFYRHSKLTNFWAFWHKRRVWKINQLENISIVVSVRIFRKKFFLVFFDESPLFCFCPVTGNGTFTVTGKKRKHHFSNSISLMLKGFPGGILL